jgi:hypothetical protein
MDNFLTKDKVKIILNNAPAGSNDSLIIQSLVNKGYVLEGFNDKEEEKTNFFDRNNKSLADAGKKVYDTITSGEGSAVKRGFEATATAFNEIPKTAYNAIPEGKFKEGVNKVGEKIGEGFNWLVDKAVDNSSILNSPKFQQWAEENPEAYQKLTDVLSVASSSGQIAGDILVGDQVAKATQTGVNAVKSGAKKSVNSLMKASEAVYPENSPISESIMNKVARVSPKEAQTFKKMTGKSMGEYLTEKGNFNSPQKIIEVEAKTFAQTLADKEATLAKLPGTYKSGVVDDVLKSLKEKAIETSTANVKAPYANQVSQWITKSKTTGLTMKEINDIKKLFEREVKLGYNKMTDATKIKQATYVDDALRTFQDETASQLGFTNIGELSKQIQASKFIVDKLGNKVVNSDLLNGVSLTDYIILSGADPASIAGFLTKKLFSNKAIQAKIAKMLSNKTVAEPVKANYSRQATQAIQPKNNITKTTGISK